MKKLIVIILLSTLSVAAMAQGGAIVSKYFDLLGSNDQYTKVSVSSKMFSLFTELEAGSAEEKEFLAAVSKLKGLKIVASDSASDAGKYYKQALADVDKAGFEELMSVKDGDQNFKFSIREKAGIIEELVMVAGNNTSFVLLSLYGEIDLKNISKIARSMRVNGFESLEKLGDDTK